MQRQLERVMGYLSRKENYRIESQIVNGFTWFGLYYMLIATAVYTGYLLSNL